MLRLLPCVCLIDPLKMKWPFRVTAAVLLLASIGTLYIYWGTDHAALWSGKPTPASSQQKAPGPPTTQTLRQSQEKPGNGNEMVVPPKKLPPSDQQKNASISDTKKHLLLFTSQDCKFGNQRPTETNISTYTILERINDAMVQPPVFKDEPGQATLKPIEWQKYEMPPHIKKQPLTVIAIPHSHSDPGWLKTVGGYFNDQTRPTLDNMVQKLIKYPNMTFVWAESVFLSMWYDDLDQKSQADVRRLIKRGQLEIVGGGWVVPDEANPHYFALVDQMIEGHQWLEQNLDVKPTNTWSLDPFGYSSTLPYLYKRSGYKNMVILRTHEQVKSQLVAQHGLEFFWQQAWDQGGSTRILTQMMPYQLYNIKHTCGPDHQICLQFDFRKIPGEFSEARAEPITDLNVERQAKLLLGQYYKKASLFRHNVLLVPLGDDFRYDRSIEWDQQFKNYMKLFNYMNLNKDLNVRARFGTVKDYFDEVRKVVPDVDTNPHSLFPSLEGDFFPYTDHHYEYWTGYFTTRAFDKNMGRELEVNLRAAEILNSLALAEGMHKSGMAVFEKNWEKLSYARQALGLFQHHDAITGTAKNYVVLDYEGRLQTGMDHAREVLTMSAAHLLNKDASQPPLLLDQPKSLRLLTPTKKLLHISQDEANPTRIILFNSVSHHREELVRLTVDSDTVMVICEQGSVLLSQMNPIWTDSTGISTSEFELVFIASLPPLSLVTYTLKDAQGLSVEETMNYAAHVRLHNVRDFIIPPKIRFTILPPAPNSETIITENDQYRLWFSAQNGLLETMTLKTRFKTVAIKLELLNYMARGSGAYLFDPVGPAVDAELERSPLVRVVRGPVTSEVHSVQPRVHHSVILYNSTGLLSHAIAINNIVDLTTLSNKEMIMRLSTDMKTNFFYTDLNGFQTVRRRRFSNFPIQANYYPMTEFAYMEDSTSRLGFISSQPHGVGSHEDGALEIMLDRRLTYDDGRGLGEGVQDNKRTPSCFYLMLERFSSEQSQREPKANPGQAFGAPQTLSHPSVIAQTLANNLRNYVFVLFQKETSSSTGTALVSPTRVDLLQQPLPCDVRLVNLRTLPKGDGKDIRAALILHRVDFQCGFASPPMSCDLRGGEVSLDKFFTGDVRVKSAVEQTLSLMFDKERVDLHEPLILDPMELYAYRITFH